MCKSRFFPCNSFQGIAILILHILQNKLVVMISCRILSVFLVYLDTLGKKRILWFIMELVTVSKACQLTHCALQPQAITQINVDLDSNRSVVTFIQGKFQKRYPSQQSLKLTWKLRINIFHSNHPCLNEVRWLPVLTWVVFIFYLTSLQQWGSSCINIHYVYAAKGDEQIGHDNFTE